MIHVWEDIRIEHPIHPPPQDTDVESVQRIVLAAPRPEPIGKPDEVLLEIASRTAATACWTTPSTS
jgi:hypothetical protein